MSTDLSVGLGETKFDCQFELSQKVGDIDTFNPYLVVAFYHTHPRSRQVQITCKRIQQQQQYKIKFSNEFCRQKNSPSTEPTTPATTAKSKCRYVTLWHNYGIAFIQNSNERRNKQDCASYSTTFCQKTIVLALLVFPILWLWQDTFSF